MQLKDGADIYTSDNEQIGKLDRVVVDPHSGTVTHLVVRKGFLSGKDKVLPVDLVEKADEDQVRVRKSSAEIGELPDFEEVHYITPDRKELARTGYQDNYANPYYWYPPYAYAQFGYRGYAARPYIPSASQQHYAKVERNIPDDAIPLQEGTQVFSADIEQVGSVERLFVDPDSGQVTHILISSGLLPKKQKLIPAMWISEVHEEKITLAVGSSLLESLPDYEDES
jgi:uncharacterized protein YrrD